MKFHRFAGVVEAKVSSFEAERLLRLQLVSICNSQPVLTTVSKRYATQDHNAATTNVRKTAKENSDRRGVSQVDENLVWVNNLNK